MGILGSLKILPQYQSLVRDINEQYIGDRYSDAPGLPVYAWYFNERERIRIEREDMLIPPPWTEDPIFTSFRFTNVRREDDRVSRELVHAMDWAQDGLATRLFNAVVFRTFNSSWGFQATGGYHYHWHPKQTLLRCNQAVLVRNGASLFGSAYLMTNSLMEGMSKHEYFINNVFNKLWEMRTTLLHSIVNNGTLQHATKLFTQFPGYSDFLGYEFALDAEMLGLFSPTDKYTWANPGPGARRGLNFVFGRPRDYKQPTQAFLEEMQWLLDESVFFLEPHVEEPFDMRCIENGLCETSKYASVLTTGRAKRRYRHRSDQLVLSLE